MQIEVQFYGGLRGRTGTRCSRIHLHRRHPTVADALTAVEAEYPGLRGVLGCVACAVGDEVVSEEYRLHDGSSLALLPPVSGGSAAGTDSLALDIGFGSAVEDEEDEQTVEDPKLRALRQMEPFAGVPASTLEQMASCFIANRYERDQCLWREESPARTFIFIVSGCVKVTKWDRNGCEYIVDIFCDEQPLNNMAAYLGEKYPVSVYALRDTTTLEIHRSHFIGNFLDNPDVLRGFFGQMVNCNQKMLSRLQELTASDTRRRLAMLFARFAVSLGQRIRLDNGKMGVYIPLPLSRKDIGQLLNVRTETAIRHMSRWNKEGPVRTDRRGFTIVDYEALRELAKVG